MNLAATKIGCHSDRRIFQYFYFPENEPIDDDGFYFDVDTYVFFNQNIRKVDAARLLKYQNPLDPFGFVKLATLRPNLFRKLLDCIALSPFVPNDLKAEIIAFKNIL